MDNIQNSESVTGKYIGETRSMNYTVHAESRINENVTSACNHIESNIVPSPENCQTGPLRKFLEFWRFLVKKRNPRRERERVNEEVNASCLCCGIHSSPPYCHNAQKSRNCTATENRERVNSRELLSEDSGTKKISLVHKMNRGSYQSDRRFVEQGGSVERYRVQSQLCCENFISPSSGQTVSDASIPDVVVHASNHAISQEDAMTNPTCVDSDPIYHSYLNDELSVSSPAALESSASPAAGPALPRRIHTQVDYVHCLVPELQRIASSVYYWGVMDRYEAEKLLDNRPEGTFLLRDSAQDEFLFSVSFRRYGRSLHARVEQWNHQFSFDSHDPSVFSSKSVCQLIEHYKDPASCMFFEPLLTAPLPRNFPFSLQALCRTTICSTTTYDGITALQIPKSLQQYLQYYHYKQKVRVRRFEAPPPPLPPPRPYPPAPRVVESIGAPCTF